MMWVPDQQMSAFEGADEVTLVCHVEAHPEALTFWEKGGRMLQSGGRFSMNQLRGSLSYKVFRIGNLIQITFLLYHIFNT